MSRDNTLAANYSSHLVVLLVGSVLTMVPGCSAQFEELPENEAVVACQEQGYQRGSLAFADCVEGGVESIKSSAGR